MIVEWLAVGALVGYVMARATRRAPSGPPPVRPGNGEAPPSPGGFLTSAAPPEEPQEQAVRPSHNPVTPEVIGGRRV
jgi:hypothetical protein